MNNNINCGLKVKIIQHYGSQVAFSKRLGVGELFVSQVINNRRKLKPEEMKTWAKALKCKPEELNAGS